MKSNMREGMDASLAFILRAIATDAPGKLQAEQTPLSDSSLSEQRCRESRAVAQTVWLVARFRLRAVMTKLAT